MEGHALNIRIVIEGIENSHQQNVLRSIDCDIAQGYFYCKPGPVSDFEELLLEQKKNKP
ncbi:EAL domain-containing protein [Thiospirochaeta perfilievii]|uniref:EAL domain-containing protein n=1 Tax=Thiospirochaeta perfilievii TaxID=252967 RepID=A0A5C1QG48_9SPIO|nr:EAL domain-containing protein [Thiospirochaeta perfilievii]